MGSRFSFIENTMNLSMFCPPKTPVDDFAKLNTDRSKLYNVMASNNNIINCVVIYPMTKSNKFIIFSHGNGTDIFNMYDYCKQLSDVLNVMVCVYDYPGYGLSTGKPSEAGCYESLNKIVEFIENTFGIKQQNMLLIGQSIGTGPTVEYAVTHDWISPIVLISPYKSIIRVLTEAPNVSCSSTLSLCGSSIDKFESHKKVGKLKCPVKIYHGIEDELINVKHSKDLFEKIENKTLKPTYFDNVEHNDILSHIDLAEIAQILYST